MSIKMRPYRTLVDFPKVYEFLSTNYSRDWHRGVTAPFFEYAQSHSMFDPTKTHRNALWEDGDRLVAMAFYEMTLGKAFFALTDGYEFLCDEMIDYAENSLCDENGEIIMCPFSKQIVFREKIQERGYQLYASWPGTIYKYEKGALNYMLPDGFAFADHNEHYDYKKHNECTWKGFDHGDEVEYHIDGILHMYAAPHVRKDLGVTVIAPNGDYACFGGMWFDERNKLAYLEPLCTVPKYRHLGLASAVISELYRKTKLEGADHMDGGDNPFYFKLGFEETYCHEMWKK